MRETNSTPPTPSKRAIWHLAALIGLPSIAALMAAITLGQRSLMEPFFVQGTYFILMAMVVCWAAAHLMSLRGIERGTLLGWLREDAAGIAVTAVVASIAILAVTPSLRILADETNLVGVSKNLFFNKTADFATTGKWYYEAYWNGNLTMDRRPALYPFFVSLIHGLRGYSYTNAFHVNAIVLVLFAFVAYRLAKSLGGKVFGVVAAALVVAHPITLVSARSGGFDVIAAFFTLLIFKNVLDYLRGPSANGLAVLWMNLCLLTHIRYEGATTFVAVVAVLLLLRAVRWEHLRPYAILYALTPAFMLPRFWQTILKAGDTEQPLSATLFGWEHFLENTRAYLGLVTSPLAFRGPHAALLIALGLVGCVLIVRSLWKAARAREGAYLWRFAAFCLVWLVIQVLMSFAYFWGKPLHPASARLFVPMDTFFSFTAAWAVVVACRRVGWWLSLAVAAFVFVAYLPVASEARFINELTLTRQAAQTWRFFESLKDKRIMIVTDRPGLYTVMDYGAVDLAVAQQSDALLIELSRHLYHDIYVIQEIDLTTNAPLPGFEIWPTRDKESVLDFQNTENSSVRISRIR